VKLQQKFVSMFVLGEARENKTISKFEKFRKKNLEIFGKIWKFWKNLVEKCRFFKKNQVVSFLFDE